MSAGESVSIESSILSYAVASFSMLSPEYAPVSSLSASRKAL